MSSKTAGWLTVAWYDADVDAQVARSMLAAHGIDARVEFEAAGGAPRSIAPAQLQAPGAGYYLRVPAARAAEARQLVGMPSSRRTDRRLLWVFVLVVFGTPVLLALLSVVTSR